MKKMLSMIRQFGGWALLISGAMLVISCEGPQGPAGADGMDGVDGADGKDANETCIVCHNAEVTLLATQQQALSSHHLTGGNYDRLRTYCAKCHTHQGFIETLATGESSTAEDVTNPAPINCRTCHMIHTNYDEDDWMLTSSSAVDLDFGDETIDLGGPSNLCVNCHQFRAVNPMPEVGGGDVEVTNKRWGPHHGPHGNNLWGIGGYLIAGDETYPEAGSAAHASLGCTSCHMAEMPYDGLGAGGHSFNMTYVSHGHEEDNVGACTACHTDLEDFDYNGVQTMVDSLVNELETIFLAKGWLEEAGGYWAVPLTVSSDEAGAMLNYKIVVEDRSGGIHNPDYILALLKNSLAAVQ